ncbi:MAG: GNAT family N-acetyltransferase [Gammaproteobacteria bacterium]
MTTTDNRVIVRDASLSDATFIADGNIAMALETENKVLDPNLTRPGVRALLEDPLKGRYFIADSAGEAAGQLMLTTEWSDWRNGDFWWIQSVYVLPAFRRHGVFRALFNHVEHAARNAPGVCGIRLYVERDNARARQTYLDLGAEMTDYDLMEWRLAK